MLAASCALAVAAATAGARAAFSPARTYPVNGEVQAVAVADVTGDRRPDVLLTDPDRLLLFAQRPDGSLAPPTAYPLAGPTSSEWNADLAVADLNRDRRPDVAVASKTGVQLFLGRRGRLAQGRTIALPFAATTVAAADLNGDGRPDLVVSGRIEQTTTPELYLLWNRRGGWQAQKLDDRFDTGIRFADINGDHKLDIVPVPSGTAVPSVLRFYLGDGHGRFTPTDQQVADTTRDAPAALAVGDVTGDHRADLLLVNAQNQPSSHLTVMAGSSTGRFAGGTSYPSDDNADALAIADLNGDRRNDVIVLHGGFGKLGIYYQQSNGTLGPEQLLDIPYSSHDDPNSIAVALDHSQPVIAVADTGAQALVLLRQP